VRCHHHAAVFVCVHNVPASTDRCALTLRWSRLAPAWHLAREAVVLIIGLAGQAPFRRSRLSSNVRRRRLRRFRAPHSAIQRLAHAGYGIASAFAHRLRAGMRKQQQWRCASVHATTESGAALKSGRLLTFGASARAVQPAGPLQGCPVPRVLLPPPERAPGPRAIHPMVCLARCPFRLCRCSPPRLTLHWSGRPPASQLGREALLVYAAPRGQAGSPASAAQLKR